MAGSLAMFAVVAVPWAVLSDGGDDPWDVIGPVAGVAAAGALAGLGWWAAQAGVAGTTRRVRQDAQGPGAIRQTGGNRGAGAGASGAGGPEDIRQRARGGGDIDQVGGNRA
ncbi:hypothetical protein [Yinghuangia soli]|uniref:Uncharacterized protein n=1 Tax=Yinghuangia soli TaxID=2908204 RepID=A0AA41Q5G2_9ACTN|nr:hypothetical protein [Yinghuangia soli]MCF2531893.1 hypothetical protein [Yinghuangia soli]